MRLSTVENGYRMRRPSRLDRGREGYEQPGHAEFDGKALSMGSMFRCGCLFALHDYARERAIRREKRRVADLRRRSCEHALLAARPD